VTGVSPRLPSRCRLGDERGKDHARYRSEVAKVAGNSNQKQDKRRLLLRELLWVGVGLLVIVYDCVLWFVSGVRLLLLR
jgi:hypothetical protein